MKDLSIFMRAMPLRLATPLATHLLATDAKNGGRDSPRGATVIQPQTSDPRQVRASNADGMSMVYSFISNLTTKQVRRLLREWRCKQSGNKGVLVARAFLNMQIILLSGKTLAQVMRSNTIAQRFGSCMTQRITLYNRSPLYLTQAPTDSVLLKELDPKEAETVNEKG